MFFRASNWPTFSDFLPIETVVFNHVLKLQNRKCDMCWDYSFFVVRVIVGRNWWAKGEVQPAKTYSLLFRSSASEMWVICLDNGFNCYVSKASHVLDLTKPHTPPDPMLCVYMCVSTYVCACMCLRVCVRVRERRTDKKTDRRRQKAGSEQYQGRKLGKGEEKLTERDGGGGGGGGKRELELENFILRELKFRFSQTCLTISPS